mgnify:FL=1
MAATPMDTQNGFFVGATELAKFLIDQGAKFERETVENYQKVIEIDGHSYIWNRHSYCWEPVKPVAFTPDDEPIPAPFSFFTLDGLVDYITENTEGLIPDEPAGRLILQVVNHTAVVLWSQPSLHHKKRHAIAQCTAHVPDIVFGKYLDTDTFNTMLLSNFIDTEARSTLFKVVKSMTKEQSLNTNDDGVSQVLTVKQGVSLAANVTFQNPVPLRPMRTFTEVSQPESNFTLRVDEHANCALFEADGGAWKNAAVSSIKSYLQFRLDGQNVAVIA